MSVYDSSHFAFQPLTPGLPDELSPAGQAIIRGYSPTVAEILACDGMSEAEFAAQLEEWYGRYESPITEADVIAMAKEAGAA